MSTRYLLKKGAETQISPCLWSLPKRPIKTKQTGLQARGENKMLKAGEWICRRRSKCPALVLWANVSLPITDTTVWPVLLSLLFSFFSSTRKCSTQRAGTFVCWCFVVSLTSNKTWQISGLQVSCTEWVNVAWNDNYLWNMVLNMIYKQ